MARCKGFTLIEVLVALVIMSLISSIAVPSINAWMEGRAFRDKVNTVKSNLAQLPQQANLNDDAIYIEKGAVFSEQYGEGVDVLEPIEVLRNGFCKSGLVAVSLYQRSTTLKIKNHACETIELNS